MGGQASNLVGVHEELVVLWATIKDMHMISFPTYPIIEEILVDDVPNI